MRTNVGGKPAQRQKMQARIMKALESKIQHKHAREGGQHSAGKTKINAIIAEIQNMRCLFCSHNRKGQRGPPRQKEGT
jgi:hypothetical protein